VCEIDTDVGEQLLVLFCFVCVFAVVIVGTHRSHECNGLCDALQFIDALRLKIFLCVV